MSHNLSKMNVDTDTKIEFGTKDKSPVKSKKRSFDDDQSKGPTKAVSKMKVAPGADMNKKKISPTKKRLVEKSSEMKEDCSGMNIDTQDEAIRGDTELVKICLTPSDYKEIIDSVEPSTRCDVTIDMNEYLRNAIKESQNGVDNRSPCAVRHELYTILKSIVDKKIKIVELEIDTVALVYSPPGDSLEERFREKIRHEYENKSENTDRLIVQLDQISEQLLKHLSPQMQSLAETHKSPLDITNLQLLGQIEVPYLKKLKMTQYNPYDLFTNFASLKALVCGELNQTSLEKLFLPLKTLTHANIKINPDPWSDKKFGTTDIDFSKSNIAHLIINVHSKKLIFDWRKLETLNIEKSYDCGTNRYVLDETYCKERGIEVQISSLKSLYWNSTSSLYDCNAILEASKNIESFKTSMNKFNYWWFNRDFDSKKLPNLVDIRIRNNLGLKGSSIEGLVDNFPNLKSLELIDCMIDNDKLKSLEDKKITSDTGKETRERIIRIEHLNLSLNPDISCSGLKRLASNGMKNLKSLTISYSDKIEDTIGIGCTEFSYLNTFIKLESVNLIFDTRNLEKKLSSEKIKFLYTIPHLTCIEIAELVTKDFYLALKEMCERHNIQLLIRKEYYDYLKQNGSFKDSYAFSC